MTSALNFFAAMGALIQRDLRLVLRRKNDSLATLFFFAVVVSLFPLGVGPEPKLLQLLRPACCGLRPC